MTADATTELMTYVEANASAAGIVWLDESLSLIQEDPALIRKRFPAATRKVGKPADSAARILMVLSAADVASAEVPDLYRYGDANERTAVLLSLDYIDLNATATSIIHDALRTNDTNLVTAALGSYALEHLSDDELRQAIMKCVFMDIPLSEIPGLANHASPELSQMLASFVLERITAGRSINGDVWRLIDAYPPAKELAAIKAELSSEHADRREAAHAALALRYPDLQD